MLVDMKLVDFHSLRNGLQANGVPASPGTRAGMGAALHDALLATGAFSSVEVGSTEEANNLLVVLADYLPGVTEDDVAAAVDRAWGKVAFHHWRASGQLVEDGHVEVLAATLDRPAGAYVTLHLVARRGEAPASHGVPAAAASLPRQRGPRRGIAARIIARSA